MPNETKSLPESDPEKKPFDPEVLGKTVIAIPLLRDLAKDAAKSYDIIIDLNLDFKGGRDAAQGQVEKLMRQAAISLGKDPDAVRIDQAKSNLSTQYVFATMEGEIIQELARLDADPESNVDSSARIESAIHRIWPDFKISPLITKSISTVKADAASNAFAAFGEEIVWAVMDSGIAKHPHFTEQHNLELTQPIEHRDFSRLGGTPETALTDEFGHGTHVAGIIAGEASAETKDDWLFAAARHRDETGKITVDTIKFKRISGMASRCKLLSLKVLDETGRGKASNLIAAIAYIQKLNGNGRFVRIHGVNMSVGYDFEPEWFACGQSPLCVEVDRLVKSGVVVVVAAGNTGYGFNATEARGSVASGLSLTINDPGNAELAITVGSTHRDMPHVYGVSYFSSKGPTGDGRHKPDLVAPGEKILSCAAGRVLDKMKPKLEPDKDYHYIEDSGTSMAAPHVSGVIAAFLSIRREFIGQPEKVKEIFLNTATDLKRDIYFQGRGLVDLMRAIQHV